MAQHFLLFAAARTLSLKMIFLGGEDAAYQRFCRLRWLSNGIEPGPGIGIQLGPT